MGTLLEIEDLHVWYGGGPSVTHAVRGVDLHVGEGELVGLLGETGSGKSSVLWSAIDLLPLGGSWSGRVSYAGIDVSSPQFRRSRGVDVGVVMQHSRQALSPFRTVGQQFTDHLRRSLTQQRRGAVREQGLAALEAVGMADAERVWDSYPHELSGGMASRAALALVIAKEPRLLLADEPTTGLDATVQAQVLRSLLRVVRERGAALLIVTHDLGVVRHVCERVVVMRDGLVVEEASTEAFFGGPASEYGRQLLSASGALPGESTPTRPTAREPRDA